MMSSLRWGAWRVMTRATRRLLGGDAHSIKQTAAPTMVTDDHARHGAQTTDNAAKPQTTREAQLSRQPHHLRLHLRSELRFDLVDPAVEKLVEDFVDDGGVVAGAGGDDVVEELVE